MHEGESVVGGPPEDESAAVPVSVPMSVVDPVLVLLLATSVVEPATPVSDPASSSPGSHAPQSAVKNTRVKVLRFTPRTSAETPVRFTETEKRT